MGEEKKTGQGVEYFELQCQYLDFDGKVFGMVTEKLAIEKFRGAKTITTLDTFPIRFHSTPDEITQFLTARGQKFIDLMGTHHQFYDGHTFYQRKEGLVRISVRSKIMIDAERFRKMHPNYPRLLVKKSDMFMSSVSEQRVRSHGLDPANLGDSELMICSPTVMGFSLNDKFWGEYAVEDIKPIEWSSTLLDRLSLPAQKKNAIKAITQSRLSRADVEKQPNRSPKGFDDVVAGKGRGINILLHGPPGVGKTFTAEALSEYYQRPLYSASAGELSADAGELELQLTRIFDIASAWNAILLLDEADVFFQRRSELTLERNRLVAVFLRKLEYFHGILFLTTNLIDHFDNALLDRIHLVMKYDDLDRTARNEVVTGFLERMPGGHRSSDISKDYLDRFACMKLNGRQIKNALAVADTLAAEQQEHLSCSHISQALALNNVVVPESSDTSFDLYD
ncbi:hypothetical protein LTS08_006041 [Lithohypha guttulata]|nr:hypothetical protein LTS08_006041 [Lithohypha guttulata]